MSISVSGANRHDVTQLEIVLDGVAVERPEPTQEKLQNLCADKGYFGAKAEEIIVEHKYTPHVRQRGEEIKAKREIPGYKARRWIVETANSWLNRFRKILVRYEKTESSYLALLPLARIIR